MERYTPAEYQQIEARGQIAERLAFAKDIGNFRADPQRLRMAILRTARRFLTQKGLSVAEIDNLAPLPAPPQDWVGMPTTGNVKVFALLIDFPDQIHTNTSDTIHDALFGAPTGADAPYESLAAYYRRASYGTLELGGGTTLGWYRAAANRADIAQTTAGREGLIKEALRHFNETGHDFRQYDNTGHEAIDYFMVFWSGPDNGWGNFWWGYQPTFSDSTFEVDGMRLGKYSWQWEGRPVGRAFSPRVAIHETGHALGLPDLYDYVSVRRSEPFGGFRPAPGAGRVRACAREKVGASGRRSSRRMSAQGSRTWSSVRSED